MRSDHNILVISDLHLGEHLKPTTTSVSYLRRIARLERELETFLEHYTAERLDGRPWRLVINGDMVDFMSVMIMPDGQQDADDEERQFGLAYGERQSTAKLDLVIARHPGIFERFARFVAAGNELVVIVGNHDAEFYFPAVQRRFVERLAALGATAAAESVRFCPWFYYEEEVIYVEHGHQYDEYCSFDYQLHPVEARGGIALSVAHAGIRYFSNLVPSLNPADAESWGFSNYIRWAAAQGARGSARIFYIYGKMVWRLVEIGARMKEPRADAERHEQHRQLLRQLAAEYRIATEKIEALDGLRRPPVLKRVSGIISAMFIDRLLLVAMSMLAMMATVLWARGHWKLSGSAGVVLLALALNAWLGRHRLVPPEARLRKVPTAIGRILRAPFIVFGHSHVPERVALDGGGVYFNTGTWVAENVRHAFTHLIVLRGAVLRAELHQWRDGASAPFVAAEHP